MISRVIANLDSQSLLRNIKPVEISTKLSTGFQMPGNQGKWQESEVEEKEN